MSQIPPPDPTSHLAISPASYPAENGGSWSVDTIESLRSSRKLAWTVAMGAGALALLQGVALVSLLPLKREVPYTITVDRATGYVQTARGVNLGPMSESEAVAKASLVQYVLSRETFDAADYRTSYQRTLLTSIATARSSYLAEWDKDNPNSLQSRYRPTTRVDVTVKNVTLTSPTTAVVAFDTVQTEGQSGGQVGGGSRNSYVAAITFGFSGAPLNEQQRYLNPLGFQVSTYRRDTQTYQPAYVPAPPPPPAPPMPAAIPPMGSVPSSGTTATATPGTGAPESGLTPEPESDGVGVPGIDPGVAP